MMRRSSLIPMPLAALLGIAVAVMPVEFSTTNLRFSVDHAEAASKSKQKVKKKKRSARGKARKGNARRGKAPAKVVRKFDSEHIAPEIVENAGKKPPLELLSDYKRVVGEGDLETAAVLLKLAAQKPVTQVLLGEVNLLLGVVLDSQDAAALVEISGTARTAAVAAQVAAEDAPSKLSERLEHAHAAVSSIHGAAVGSPVERLAAYKRAIDARNLPAAVVALRDAAKSQIDGATVVSANSLLDLDMPEETAHDLAQLSQASVLAF